MTYLQDKSVKREGDIGSLVECPLLSRIVTFQRELVARCVFAMKLRNLTTEEKGRIVGLHEAGISGAQIGRQLGIARQTVSALLKRFQLRGTVVSPKPTGARCKLGVRDKRQLKHLILRDRRAPIAAIQAQMTTKVCIRTLRRYIRALGFNNRVAVKKPFLSKAHKAQRLAFAQAHAHWSEEDWKNVIWTDESSFEVGKHSRLVRVWRQVYERYAWDCLCPSFKSGRVSIMIWGAFSGYHKSPIVIIPTGRRTAADFVNIVYEGALFSFYSLHDRSNDMSLMEDGAPVHRSSLSNRWREAQSMAKLNWPPNSPDLNPIENLWKIVKDQVQNKHRPRDRDQMASAVQREWNGVSRDVLDTLISTMPYRMKAVIDAQGGSSRW